MKGKKEYIILAAIIIAVAAYLGLRQSDRSHYQLPQIVEVSRKDISKIEITGPQITGNGEPIVINRKEDGWRIMPKDYPVDPEKIDRILDTVSGLKLSAMVSESKNDQLYELSPEKRIQVKAWVGQDLKREFEVGKSANTFRHTFVKIAGDERVFHAEDNFRERFETTIEALRDKSVLAFKVDDIGSIKITRDGKTTEFNKKESAKEDNQAEKEALEPEKKSTEWITIDNTSADPSKIRSFLFALSDLKCKTYLNDRTKEDLKDPVISITLSGTKTYQLSVYAHEKKDGDDPLWPAQSSVNDYPFLIVDWTAKDIVKGPKDLMPDKSTQE